jgi:hypothetical protein
VLTTYVLLLITTKFYSLKCHTNWQFEIIVMYYYVLKETFDETKTIMHTTIIAVALVTFIISIIRNCESVAVSLPKTHRFNKSK